MDVSESVSPLADEPGHIFQTVKDMMGRIEIDLVYRMTYLIDQPLVGIKIVRKHAIDGLGSDDDIGFVGSFYKGFKCLYHLIPSRRLAHVFTNPDVV